MEEIHKHVAVFAFPFATHAAPLLNLVRAISLAAPDVSFTFFGTAKSNASLFPQGESQGKIKPHDVWDGVPEGCKHSGNPDKLVDLFFKAAPGNFMSAVAESGCKFSCLLTDSFFWFGADVGEELGVPWIPFWTAGPRALFLHVDVDNIRRHLGTDVREDKTLDFIPSFSALRVADMPRGIITESYENIIPFVLNKMGKYLPRAAAIAINSFEELDYTVINLLKLRFKKLLNIGPLAITSPMSPSVDLDKYDCLKWLDGQKPASVAYISFGSIVVLPKPELLALIEALEDKRIPFIWSFRGDLNEQLPQKLIERVGANGKFVPWAPQLKVLEHRAVGMFITHGGWNSVLEGIISGVPMICRPFFGDQGLNSRCVEALWGIGLGIEGGRFTKNGTRKALESICSSEERMKMKEKIEIEKETAYNSAAQSNGSSIENFKTLVDIITK